MNNIIVAITCISLFFSPLNLKRGLSYEDMTIEQRASVCSMTTDDFIFISSVVEAESDRSTSGDLSGRVMIAVTILNRVNSDLFPNSISEVLNQANQFSTVQNNASCVDRTIYSDLAVIEAVQWIESGDAPAVLFFNCRGFFSGRASYGDSPIGGNYFSY